LSQSASQSVPRQSVSVRTTYTTVWQPNEGPQSWLISCPIFETLFGGARGGGKSDGVLGEWASHADTYGENAIGLCVRRERTQLVELIERSKVLYFPIGARFGEQDKLWRFPNGARLRFAYLENDNDAQAYQGHSYTRVYVEEMGTFPNPEPIFKLMATLRSGASVPCRFIATANPGGPGHSWIKARYIDPSPIGMKILPTIFKNPFTKEEILKERIFIPSKVTDNPYTNTKEYIGNLYLSGNADLVKAWLLGDWNVMLGAFFPEWDVRRHVIRTFRIPRHWTRFTSMDWGTATPFSVGWWAVVPDEFDAGLEIYPEQWQFYKGQAEDTKIELLPKGAIIRYKEWYGSRNANNLTVSTTENMNVGLKLTAEEVAQGINAREMDEPRNEFDRPKISYRVADPKMFTWDSGPSIAERMSNAPYFIGLSRADNKRVPRAGAMGGWDMVRARLKGDGVSPMLFVMDNCTHLIRTLPILQHDELKMEDVDSDSEDHAPDECRYACMSRPYSAATHTDIVRRKLRKKDNSLVLHDFLEEMKNPKNIDRRRII
jgi:Terminase large subunit, T4likevirus-type, N-terminal